VVGDKSFGAALVYFTGSKNFNIKIRQLGIKKGLKINEYGIFRKNKFVCGKTEEEIFKALGMSYVTPELREDTGEIELALKNKLPQLIELKDIKGDFHAHSSWSDGGNSIEEMAQAAIKIGYSYIAITDHSQSLKVANGLTPAELKKKKTEIEKINIKLKDFRILYATEVDIDSQGAIDYPDKILAEFDIVVAAIHTGFKQSAQQITKRMVNACKNKYVNIITHPTGRLWGTREPYDINFDELFKAAKGSNTFLEINAYPQRLDLNDVNSRRAKEAGIKLAIGTDSHSVQQLQSMHLGVSVARRGWLSPEDVINALPVEKMLKMIKK
jgi:DNA polymerase (family 10)